MNAFCLGASKRDMIIFYHSSISKISDISAEQTGAYLSGGGFAAASVAAGPATSCIVATATVAIIVIGICCFELWFGLSRMFLSEGSHFYCVDERHFH